MNYLHERTGEKKEREDIAIENGMLTSTTTTLSSSIREHHLVFFLVDQFWPLTDIQLSFVSL